MRPAKLPGGRIAPMPEPQTLIVQSPQNARIKALRAALQQPLRTGERGLIGIEGIHLLDEALRSGLAIETVFVRAGSESLVDSISGAQLVSVAEEILRGAVSTEAPQAVAALVHPPAFTIEDVFGDGPPLVLVVAGLQDPGNLGTIVRSAEAFGATGILVLPGTVSLWNAKCVRASAGSVFRLPVVAVSIEDARDALATRVMRSLATVVSGGSALDSIDLRQPCALWIGNEGSGLSAELIELCDAGVTISTPGAVESLNAAVAASVLLYEASRQRSTP